MAVTGTALLLLDHNEDLDPCPAHLCYSILCRVCRHCFMLCFMSLIMLNFQIFLVISLLQPELCSNFVEHCSLLVHLYDCGCWPCSVCVCMSVCMLQGGMCMSGLFCFVTCLCAELMLGLSNVENSASTSVLDKKVKLEYLYFLKKGCLSPVNSLNEIYR